MKILVLNSGSSSMKFKLYDSGVAIASGLVDKIGESESNVKLKNLAKGGEIERKEAVANHQKAVKIIEDFFHESGILGSLAELGGCGHRVVHGGKNLTKPCLIDDAVLAEIERVAAIAPLHNPAHLVGMRAMLAAAPAVPNVAVFDTAFHATLPPHAFMYPLPYELCEQQGIRKYGFHGTSHEFVSKKAAEFLGFAPSEFNAITLHLGNGASVCAVQNGKSIDTSMGLTPLEGLMMGTRCGSIDPAVVPHLMRALNLNAEQIDTLMNKKSGFLGVCGHNDLRDVENLANSGDERAKLALEMFVYRIVKTIGSYFAVLARVDALVFTAGIGENSDFIRLKVCEKLARLGFEIDETLNKGVRGELKLISKANSLIKILIVPTDEEFAIAELTQKLVKP